MTLDILDPWLEALGYDPSSSSCHRPNGQRMLRHPYAPELLDLLNPVGDIRAEAVFDIEGMPTVTFFVDDGALLDDSERLTALRQRIWNQGLISLVLVVTPTHAIPVPVAPKHNPAAALPLVQARPDGPYSAPDILSGEIRDRHPDWFKLEERVDRKLLKNLRLTVERIEAIELESERRCTREYAQQLVAQTLFLSYLEHRGIVGDRYRHDHRVRAFGPLIKERDREGLDRLLAQLKEDFNGDFLEHATGSGHLWRELPEEAFRIIDDLLSATDQDRAQPSFFPYNFRYIPVELLSGIYESFLGDEQKLLSAYYTPRHLANLAVSQAFDGSTDILAETVFDGACGSGILLTTAFRRMLGEAEARAPGRPLPLRERITLLQEHIFGSDLSDAACRVTAFSLYLSLLERLEPSDVAALCDDAKVKLPTLRGRNLFSGQRQGDFFSPDNPHFARAGGFTICLSNPPWAEPDVNIVTSADRWAANAQSERALRQMAADFAWRADDALAPTGRLCLILPMSLLLKSTSQPFLKAWLRTKVRWRCVINFGDLKELLFDTGRFSCVVLLADRRPAPTSRWIIPPNETFDYWVPKADVGLVFGRLTLHGVDRHQVQTQAVAADNRELVTRMWGDSFDLALWARLRLQGTFGHMFEGKRPRWVRRKGFHRTDKNAPPELACSSEPLHDRRFIAPPLLYDAPVVDVEDALPFPASDIPTIPRPVDDLMPYFDGPRILFPDGPAPDRTIRAAFVSGPASFMSSVGVIAGPAADEDLLRFTAVYLRSNLVRYFMVTQLYQLLSDRDRVSLRDIEGFPFVPPDRHPQPARAQKIVAEVAALSREIEQAPALSRADLWAWRRAQAESLIQAYFGLDQDAQAIVNETIQVIVPNSRKYGYSRVFELARQRVSIDRADAYARTLRAELEAWRDASKGRGEFEVQTLLTEASRAGPFGVVRVALRDRASDIQPPRYDDAAVHAVVAELRRLKLLPAAASADLAFVPDVWIVSGNSVYLVKPQAERFWLRRQALRDAEQVVHSTRRLAEGAGA